MNKSGEESGKAPSGEGKLSTRPGFANRVSRHILHMGLLPRLLIAEVLVFLLLFSGGVLLTSHIANSLRNNIKQERLVLGKAIADDLDASLNAAIGELQQVAAEYRLSGDVRETQSTFDALAKTSKMFNQGIVMVGSGGGVIGADNTRANLTEQDLSPYIQPLQSQSGGVSGVQTLAFHIGGYPTPWVAIAVPVGSGYSGVYVIGFLDTANSYPAQVVNQAVRLGGSGHADIIDSGGIDLFSTEAEHLLVGADHPNSYRSMFAKNKATVAEFPQEEKGARLPGTHLMAFVPLKTVPWAVSIGTTVSQAFAPVQRVWYYSIGFLAVLSGFAFLATIFIGRRLVKLNNASVAMTRDLAKAQEALVSRNQGLSALNSISTTVSQSLNLEDILVEAIKKVMEVTGTEAGCVLLSDLETKRLKPASHVGSSRLFDCVPAASAQSGCVCYEVLRTGRPLVVNDISQCPLIGGKTSIQGALHQFVSVPLQSKDKALGVMNIACSGNDCFTEDDFKLLESIGRHVGLAVENSTLYQEARQKEEVRGQLLNDLISAQEDERKRVSREFHDGFGQTLTGLIMSIESAETTVSPDGSQLKEKLANARTVAVCALRDMRKLLQDLRSPILDDAGLVAAIRSYSETHLEAAGIHLKFEAQPLNGRLSSAVETALFRIVQEAVHNILRHARASNARITIKIEDARVFVVIEDDGQGFDAASFLGAGGAARSFGVMSMRERTTLLGGTFSINSKKGQGTQVVVEIPIDTKGNEEATHE